MDKVPRPVPRKDDEITELGAYSVKEAQYLLECLSQEPLNAQVMIRLMLDTGCRRGEVAGLRWQDVDFEARTVKICNNLQYSAKKGVYATTPKGKKNRVIDVDPQLMELMRELKLEQSVKSPLGYCFVHNNGKLYSPQYATNFLLKFGAKYNIKNLHPHALRHTAASIAITSGADVASVSAKLGHADKSTTLDMYTHTNPEAILRANEIYRQALYARG
jgi:integrase